MPVGERAKCLWGNAQEKARGETKKRLRGSTSQEKARGSARAYGVQRTIRKKEHAVEHAQFR